MTDEQIKELTNQIELTGIIGLPFGSTMEEIDSDKKLINVFFIITDCVDSFKLACNELAGYGKYGSETLFRFRNHNDEFIYVEICDDCVRFGSGVE